jgi:hypothetical protein
MLRLSHFAAWDAFFAITMLRGFRVNLNTALAICGQRTFFLPATG